MSDERRRMTDFHDALSEAVIEWNTRNKPITLMSPITTVSEGEPQTYVPLRTCHATKVDPFTWGCSECGGHWHDAVTYCPWCGAKVVEE